MNFQNCLPSNRPSFLNDTPIGKHTLDYDLVDFGFDTLILSKLNEFLQADDKSPLTDLSLIHKTDDIAENIEKYRQYLFSIFRGEDFQSLYRPFVSMLMREYFNPKALAQCTPTARIQLANGGTSVSYHTDGWYGHGDGVTSFWVPLVDVARSNSLHMIENEKVSLEIISDIESNELDLDEINNICRDRCAPVELNVGGTLAFASSMLHGTEINQTNGSRISFDFRIAWDENSLGTKPRSNYMNIEQATASPLSQQQHVDEPKVKQRQRAFMYSSLSKGVSAKSQLMFLSEYARTQNIDIVGSESEIVTMSHAPVIKKYLKRENLNYELIIIFSVNTLPESRAVRDAIYQLSLSNQVPILFAAEGLSLKSASDIDEIESTINL